MASTLVKLMFIMFCEEEDLIIYYLQDGVFFVTKILNHLTICFYIVVSLIRIWCLLLKEFGMLWVVPESCLDLLALCHGIHVSKRGQVLWMVVESSWALCLEHSMRIFKGVGIVWIQCGIG